MPQDKVPLIIMTGVSEASEAENMMAGALAASTLDSIEKALAAGNIGPIIIATNSTRLLDELRNWPVLIERDHDGEKFHFGFRLREIINDHRLEKVIYLGGGSGVLLNTAQLRQIADDLLKADSLLITNNFYSTDFCAFTPASHINEIHPPPYDNDLGWRMGQKNGLPNVSLPRSAATQLDIDTPVDLMVLTLSPEISPRLKSYLDGLNLDIAPIRKTLKFFVNRSSEIALAGRISSTTLAFLEQEAACRVRVFSEERGMRASGRQDRGEVRSLLGYYYQKVGPKRFFATMGEMAQALYFDNRVLWVHSGSWAAPSDRFNSDLRRPELIQDEFLRAFTEAAVEAPIPVIMGGHSLISGDMFVIVDSAWETSGVDVPRWVNHTFWGEPAARRNP
jgi:hypothetical protein